MGARHERLEPFTLSQGLLREGWEDAVAEVLSRRIVELRRKLEDNERMQDSRPERE